MKHLNIKKILLIIFLLAVVIFTYKILTYKTPNLSKLENFDKECIDPKNFETLLTCVRVSSKDQKKNVESNFKNLPAASKWLIRYNKKGNKNPNSCFLPMTAEFWEECSNNQKNLDKINSLNDLIELKEIGDTLAQTKLYIYAKEYDPKETIITAKEAEKILLNCAKKNKKRCIYEYVMLKETVKEKDNEEIKNLIERFLNTKDPSTIEEKEYNLLYGKTMARLYNKYLEKENKN